MAAGDLAAENVDCATFFLAALPGYVVVEGAEDGTEGSDELFCSTLVRTPVERRFFLEDEAMLVVSNPSKSAYDWCNCWIFC